MVVAQQRRDRQTGLTVVVGGGRGRLIGVGISDLAPGGEADATGDLLDPQANARARAEAATDTIRARFGRDAIIKGRALR